MANKLNWSLGHNGKGNYYDDGSISTWNIDGQGNPHHQQEADGDRKPLTFLFYISPEGGINDGGLGFNNQSPKSDEQIIAEIVDADQMLYDGTDDPLLTTLDPGRRTQTDQGYGHAYNLLNILSKLAEVDKSGWAKFHTEFEIPRHIRQDIRKWADKLDWPEGAELDDARRYHITVLSLDEYCPKFEDWMRGRVKGRKFTFTSTGLDLFGDAVVLRLDCPEWYNLAIQWGEVAYQRGLSPRRFPGGPKCHITIGKTVDGQWPQGVPDPHIEFTTGRFNVNRNSHKTADAAAMSPVVDITPKPFEPVDELQAWLDTVPITQQQPFTLHHNSEDEIVQQGQPPVAQGHPLDPPSHPYEPYDWAKEGRQASPYFIHPDWPGDEYPPPDWTDKQRAIQKAMADATKHFTQGGTSRQQDEKGFPVRSEDPMGDARALLVQHLERLALDDEMIDDVVHRWEQQVMDTAPAPQNYVADVPRNVPTERQWPEQDLESYQADPELADDRPGQWAPSMDWQTEEEMMPILQDAHSDAMDELRTGIVFDQVADHYGDTLRQMGLAPDKADEWIDRLHQEWADQAPYVFRPEDQRMKMKDQEGNEILPWSGQSGQFMIPPGWNQTPAEEEALLWQHMNDAVEKVRNGGSPDTAHTTLDQRLRGLRLPVERRQYALEQFAPMLEQAKNEYAQSQEMAVQPAPAYCPSCHVGILKAGPNGQWCPNCHQVLTPSQRQAPAQPQVPNTLPPDWTAKTRRIAREVLGCFECGSDHPSDEPCPQHLLNDPQHKQMQREWYDQAWSQPGSPTPFPPEPMHWRHEHSPNMTAASAWTEESREDVEATAHQPLKQKKRKRKDKGTGPSPGYGGDGDSDGGGDGSSGGDGGGSA